VHCAVAPKPKGQEDSAQGFNQVSTLGEVSVKRRALKGRKKGLARGAAFIEKDCTSGHSKSAALTRQSFRNALSELHPRSGLGMLSGRSRMTVRVPRVETWLKPWAESCCPFGTWPPRNSRHFRF
jgi:hypothetical protein